MKPKKLLLLILPCVIITSLILVKAYACKIDKDNFYGNWVVESFITSGKGTSYDEIKVQETIGKVAIYLKEKAIFNGLECNNPVYKKEVLLEKDFFPTHSYVSFSRLGIKDKTVTKIEVFKDEQHIWNNIGSEFLVIDKNTLILYDDGAFFKLVRKTFSKEPK